MVSKVWIADPDHAIAEWHNVLLTTWRSEISIAALEVSRVASHDLHARYPAGLIVFNIIKHGIPIPPALTRAKAAAVLGETGNHVLCTATIIQGEGFWASTARAVLATITLFSRAPHPHKVFGTTEKGAVWAKPHLRGDGATTADLVDVADAVTQLGLSG